MTYRPADFCADDRDDGDISLTHMPLLARVEGASVVLDGHIARANAPWKHEPATAVSVFRMIVNGWKRSRGV